MSPGGSFGRTLPRFLTWPVDAAVTVALWTYFTLGFVVLVAPLYLLAAALATDRARACQKLNSLFFRGFFGLCRMLMPRQRWEVDPALAAVSGSVVVCNHVSYLDPLLLIALFPRHTTVVKDRLFRIPVFGAVLRLSGHLASTSLGPEAERTLEQLERLPAFLAGGGNLFVFPEGTRSRDGAVGPLNAGAFKIARLCRAPVAVAAIENTQLLFTPGRFLFDTCRANTIRVKLLAQFTPAYDRPDFSARALMAQARELLESASHSLYKPQDQQDNDDRTNYAVTHHAYHLLQARFATNRCLSSATPKKTAPAEQKHQHDDQDDQLCRAHDVPPSTLQATELSIFRISLSYALSIG